ncbi:MAG: aminotransferase class V-fold PLP-dependent enzyme [Rhodobacteraceae bacterium]|nr:aminotransferase class V-fold PLP-dependent enzyme [Paracoccaceae bacterium]
MVIDLSAVQAQTPGLQHGTHLLACGAALMPRVVVDAITDHIQLEAQIGGYEAAAQQSEMLDGVYSDVARLLGAKPQEIALMENATAAWCQVFYGLKLKAGDRVLTCQAEYAANYVAYLQRAARDGIIIEVIPNDDSGAIDLAALEAMLAEPAALISITWIPTNGGLVNPAAGVGLLARKYGVPYLLDACQAVGQMPVDVAELGCDYLSATGRKFLRGPRGIGFLYIREEMIAKTEPAVIDLFAAPWVETSRYELRADARRFENWENAYALRAGLGAAVRYALEIGMEAIQDRAWGLAERLRSGLRQHDGIILHDAGNTQCAIVSFSITDAEPNALVAYAKECGISIATSTPSSTLLDAEARNLPTMVRAAPHYYNSEKEIDQLLACIQAYRQTLR